MSRLRHRHGLAAVALCTVAALAIGACGTSPTRQETAERPTVAEVAGWTRVATTHSYLFVVNILPAEPMFTDTAHDGRQATEGERVLSGKGAPVGEGVRHVEAHIYDIKSGLPLSTIHPTITVTIRSTGLVLELDPVLMEDVVIGAADRHYGNNVALPGGNDIAVRVAVDGEEATVDGHLD